MVGLLGSNSTAGRINTKLKRFSDMMSASYFNDTLVLLELSSLERKIPAAAPGKEPQFEMNEVRLPARNIERQMATFIRVI